MKPGDKPFMMHDEFENMWATSGLINDSFGTRDSVICFSNAMMT